MSSYKDYLNSLHFSDYAQSIDNLNNDDFKRQTASLELNDLNLQKQQEGIEDTLSTITDIKDQATTIGTTALGVVGTVLGAKHAAALKNTFNRLTGRKEDTQDGGDEGDEGDFNMDEVDLPSIGTGGGDASMPPPDLQAPPPSQIGQPLPNTDGVPGGMQDRTGGLDTVGEESEEEDFDDDAFDEFADNVNLPSFGDAASGATDATTSAISGATDATTTAVSGATDAISGAADAVGTAVTGAAEAGGAAIVEAGATIAASTGIETFGIGAIIGAIISLIGVGVSAAEGIASATSSNSEDSTVDQELVDKKQEVQDSLEAHTTIYRNSNVLPTFSSTQKESLTNVSF